MESILMWVKIGNTSTKILTNIIGKDGQRFNRGELCCYTAAEICLQIIAGLFRPSVSALPTGLYRGNCIFNFNFHVETVWMEGNMAMLQVFKTKYSYRPRLTPLNGNWTAPR